MVAPVRGYQAAFNGLAIQNLLLVSEENRPAALKHLDDAQVRHEKFCTKSSPWRETVIMIRAQEEAKKSIEVIIGSSFKGATFVAPSKRNDTNLYKNLLNKKLLQFPAAPSADEEKLWISCGLKHVTSP